MRQLAEVYFPVRDYDLEMTLTCGQAFRWRQVGQGWEGVVAGRWVRLEAVEDGLLARCVAPVAEWGWLEHYLQVRIPLEPILRSFPPQDPFLQEAVQACRGLRLLRQDPWECLASFILSSTKRITHIQQIIERLCHRWGRPLVVPAGREPVFDFPAAAALAQAGEEALRSCGMGFRARALAEAARAVAMGTLDLAALGALEEAQARERLMALRGVGPKIANCVLLFAYGFPGAFPVDVWVRRALQAIYLRRRRMTPRCRETWIRTHFGPQAGYAQQYLFHYWRMRQGKGGTREKPALTQGQAGL